MHTGLYAPGIETYFASAVSAATLERVADAQAETVSPSPTLLPAAPSTAKASTIVSDGKISYD